jgi:two-component system chemotaxis sensor kinase CheA
MHLLRNAISHGIESPEERRRTGKNPRGSLKLRLEAHGRRLRIDVEDDGRGIDVQRITRVAIEKRLLPADEARRRTPEELIRLVFEPGFSTLSTTTELAGRGMGLSVVREAVRHLQGEVELGPNAGAGALVRLSVPLFVANHHVVVVACQGQKFALPSHNVSRLYRKKASEIRIVEGNAALEIEGTVMPLYSLASLLETGDGKTEERELLAVMVVHSGSRKIAITVDGLLDQREALIKDLGFPAGAGPKVLGGILLPDSSVCVVLNPVGLAEAAGRAETFVSRTETKAGSRKPSASILVVDDSMTTRSLEKMILETQGYRVRLAVDGMDALVQLRQHSADLVITDIQMPKMDGFQLIEEMRKDKELTGIPVIVVSSLEKTEDQERGLALGIDAYVVKRKFDQKELLDAIRQIV